MERGEPYDLAQQVRASDCQIKEPHLSEEARTKPDRRARFARMPSRDALQSPRKKSRPYKLRNDSGRGVARRLPETTHWLPTSRQASKRGNNGATGELITKLIPRNASRGLVVRRPATGEKTKTDAEDEKEKKRGRLPP